MKLIAKLSSIFDRIISLFAFLAGVIIIFMMMSVCAGVVMRYFFNQPLVWEVEVNEVALLFVTFLGTAWVLKREGHVKMEIVVDRLSPRSQNVVDVFTSTISAILLLFFVWYGTLVTWDHFQRGLYQATALSIPNAAVLFIIPVGSFLLCIQFLRRARGFLTSWKASQDRRKGLIKETIS